MSTIVKIKKNDIKTWNLSQLLYSYSINMHVYLVILINGDIFAIIYF